MVKRKSRLQTNMFGNESYGSMKILRVLKLVPVQVRPWAPFLNYSLFYRVFQCYKSVIINYKNVIDCYTFFVAIEMIYQHVSLNKRKNNFLIIYYFKFSISSIDNPVILEMLLLSKPRALAFLAISKAFSFEPAS